MASVRRSLLLLSDEVSTVDSKTGSHAAGGGACMEALSCSSCIWRRSLWYFLRRNDCFFRESAFSCEFSTQRKSKEVRISCWSLVGLRTTFIFSVGIEWTNSLMELVELTPPIPIDEAMPSKKKKGTTWNGCVLNVDWVGEEEIVGEVGQRAQVRLIEAITCLSTPPCRGKWTCYLRTQLIDSPRAHSSMYFTVLVSTFGEFSHSIPSWLAEDNLKCPRPCSILYFSQSINSSRLGWFRLILIRKSVY